MLPPIDPAWSLFEAVEAAHDAYVGGGRTSAGYRNSIILAWANVVGRRQALGELTSAIRREGGRRQLAQALGLSLDSLRRIEKAFAIISDHSVVFGLSPTAAALDDLNYGESLGEGGTGRVWLATDAVGRTVAVKFVSEGTSDAEQVAIHHARALAAGGGHPNVVTVYYCRALPRPEDDGERRVGIVMEYVRGETLTRRLRRALTTGSARKIGEGIASGVAFLHARGVAHGDLHSDNVLVNEEDHPKLIDIYNEKSIKAGIAAVRSTDVGGDVAGLAALLDQVAFAAGHPDESDARLQDQTDLLTDAISVRDGFLRRFGPRLVPGLDIAREFIHLWSGLETMLEDLAPRSQAGTRRMATAVVSQLVAEKRMSKRLAAEFHRIRLLRNKFVHGRTDALSVEDLTALHRLMAAIRQESILGPTRV